LRFADLGEFVLATTQHRQYFEKENVKKVLDASCGSGEQAMALAGLDLQV
jgi:ubiquinone/menaquinone biosynthesis C-methylase UbiE